MKRLTDAELLGTHMELLVLRLSVYSRLLGGAITENSVSPALQALTLYTMYCGFGWAGAYAASTIGLWVPIGFVAGLALGMPAFKPMSKYFRQTVPKRRVAKLRERLATAIEISELHCPLALLVEEAIQTEGLDCGNFDTLVARRNAGELDDLSFAAEALALAPRSWSRVCKLAYKYHFKKAELLTCKVEKQRPDVPPSIEKRLENQQGINLSYSFNLEPR